MGDRVEEARDVELGHPGQAAVADERAEAHQGRAAIGAAAGGVGPAAVAGGGESGLHAGVEIGERGPQAEPVAGGVGEQEPLVGLDQAGDAAGVEDGRDGADAGSELVAGRAL
ncbi:MAG: hypothetical protein FJ286_10510 [Planctomycetes bacterium]|nr:hypothetical protein [Planctomycetota bacterium]